MKDIVTTLRRLDEEIVGHHQNIARSQVEIMRLQDTRKVLMRLVEDDQHAAEAAAQERLGSVNGAHAKPVLIVRKTGSDEPAKAAKTKRDYKTDSAKYGRRNKPSVSGGFRDRIAKLLAGAEAPMTSQEIGDHLGVPRGDAPRKPMSNALYQMRIRGDVKRDPDHRYSRPGEPQ